MEWKCSKAGKSWRSADGKWKIIHRYVPGKQYAVAIKSKILNIFRIVAWCTTLERAMKYAEWRSRD